MDRASQALARGVPPGVPNTYRALEDYSGVSRATLQRRKKGGPSIADKAKGQRYLRDYEEAALVQYLVQLSDLGQPVRLKFIPFLAFCITRKRATNRPLKPPHAGWTTALVKRYPGIKAIRVRPLKWNRHENNIHEKTVYWLTIIERLLHDPVILPENVYNMDETGVMLAKPGTVKVLMRTSDLRTHRGARVKRTTITAIECISADGRYLNPLIIWPATTHRSNWVTYPTPGWQYALQESGYVDSYISLEWLKRIFNPETKDRAGHRPRVLICDGFGTHETLEILEFCFMNDIILCRLPSHTSHKLQPCDVATFAPLKSAYREQVDRLERGGVNTIGKQHFTYLYSPARVRAFTPKNIKAGFAATGLYPFNPDRVMRTIPKPAEPTAAPQVNERGHLELTGVPLNETRSALQESPVTPVSAEGLLSLQDMILKQDTSGLTEASKQRLQRHIQKLAKAAQASFAKGALQQNQIQLMMTINDEAKVRRSTKSVVLGTAKVMGYEDLAAARAKRAEQDAAKAKGTAKSKRGRKRKNAAVETTDDTIEDGTTSSKQHKRTQKRKSVTCTDSPGDPKDDEEPYQIPVARMY